MANELLTAVTSSPFDTKTLTDTFAAVAAQNNKRRELDLKAQENAQNEIFKAGSLDMREKVLGLRAAEAQTRETAAEVLTGIRMRKLEDAQKALQDARDYNEAMAAATVDGKSLTVRLKSSDPTEAEAAYRTFSQIRDRFRASPSPIVNADIKSIEGLPYIQAKAELAANKEKARAEEAARRADQRDRGLDQKDNVIAETVTHDVVKEKQSGQRIEQAGKRIEETGRHNTVTEGQADRRGDQADTRNTETNRHNTTTEGVADRNATSNEKRTATGALAQGETVRHHTAQEGTSQQNADTRRMNADNRASGSGDNKPLGLNVPNLGYVSMPKIRRVLAAGIAPGATKQQAADADVLRKGLLAIPSGSKNPDTGAMIPRFSGADIMGWSQQGEAEMAAAKAAPPATPGKIPGLVPPPAGAPPAAPAAAPAAPTVTTPQVMPPAAAPAATPAPSSPAQDLLKKYKIPSSRPAADAGSADATDVLFGATQNYLANLGIVPAAPTSAGFGGFGLPAA